MPWRELTVDGKVCRMLITNVHPDGTEFLPEEFTITGRSEQELNILRLACRLAERKLERDLLEIERICQDETLH